MSRIPCAFEHDALRKAVSEILWNDCNKQHRMEMLCDACRANAFGETDPEQLDKAKRLFHMATKGLKS